MLTQVTANSSITSAEYVDGLNYQSSTTFVGLTSVATPGGTDSFTYDSWGSVILINLPTGGSISYEYETRGNSPYIGYQIGYGTSFSRVVKKRTISTGSGPGTGQASATEYHFDTVTIDQYNRITAENGRTVSADGSYTATPTVQSGGDSGIHKFFTPAGVLLKTVVEEPQPLTYPVSFIPDITTTTWPDGRVDQTTTGYVDSSSIQWYNESEFVGSMTPESQSFSPLPLSLYLPASQIEYEIGLNNAAGAVARRTVTRYFWQDHPEYVTDGLFDLPSTTIVYDSQGNVAQSSNTIYDESSYSSSGTKGNATTVSSGDISTHAFYNYAGLVTSQLDGRGKTPVTVQAFQCSDAYPHVVKNSVNQQTTYNYDCNTGLVSSVATPNGITGFSYDSVNNLVSTTYPDSGSVRRLSRLRHSLGGYDDDHRRPRPGAWL